MRQLIDKYYKRHTNALYVPAETAMNRLLGLQSTDRHAWCFRGSNSHCGYYARQLSTETKQFQEQNRRDLVLELVETIQQTNIQ